MNNINTMNFIPIPNMEALENYYKESYNTKGKIIEGICTRFLQYHNLNIRPITTRMLQKTQGDTVANMVIPNIANKQLTAEFKAGGSIKGYNDLCIDIAYYTKEGKPYSNNGTNIGWLFTTVSDFVVVVVPKAKKLYLVNWYGNGIHSKLIRAYSLYMDRINSLPNWVTIDIITSDKNKNTEVFRINLNELLTEFPECISEYSIVCSKEYENMLNKLL